MNKRMVARELIWIAKDIDAGFLHNLNLFGWHDRESSMLIDDFMDYLKKINSERSEFKMVSDFVKDLFDSYERIIKTLNANREALEKDENLKSFLELITKHSNYLKSLRLIPPMKNFEEIEKLVNKLK